jgi:hexosaminidase
MDENGMFKFTPETVIVARGEAEGEAKKLVRVLAPAMGFELKTAKTPGKGSVVLLELDAALEESLGKEGYRLRAGPELISISAAQRAGLFYGIQTLRQLLPPAIYGSRKAEGEDWSVPCLKITDYPRFGWRGLLIDPARHFIPVKDFKHYVDAMAVHKLNRLQIHLTDNEGWRIEIKRYPKLTTVGSKSDRSGRGPGHGGFYSQSDMRDIVRYALDRHITIIPEIEMPAHTGAASYAYPEELALKPKRNGHVLAPRPAAVTFMQNVLTEIMDIFPSRHIHIGGDEANTGVWKSNEEMQEQMRRMGHANVHELHSWFIRQMDTFLTEKGRRLVGWDEILQGGLASGATVMSWRGTSGGIAAAKAGHDVVMAPTSHTYFDYRQAPKELGLGRSVIDVQKVYAFEPIPADLNADEARHVLGGQGQLWGELIKDRERREFMTYPRACALAEVLWSPKDARDFNGFLPRLNVNLKRLRASNVNYRRLDDLLIVGTRDSEVEEFDYFENN